MNNMPIHIEKYIAYYRLQDFAKAAHMFERSLEVGYSVPASVQFYLNVGYMYGEIKEFRKALDYYKKAREIDPTNLSVLESLAYVAKELGDRETAKDAALKMKEIDPSASAKVEAFLEELEGDQATP